MYIPFSNSYLTRFSLWIPVMLLLCNGSIVLAQDIDSFYGAVDTFMDRYVEKGRVDYSAIHDDTGSLDQIVKMIGALDRDALSDADHQAFLVNAYNLLVIKNVSDHYPISSPLDVEEFFDSKTFQVDGKTYSLNELEKGQLYASYPDARFHFVLVCAAIGCPVLIESAYRGATLEEQLTNQTRLALNDNKHVRTDAGTHKVYVSQLFSWYEADFSRDGKAVDFINKYRDEAIPGSFEVDYIEYNWQLNEKKR